MTIKKAIKYRDIWMGVAMLWIILYHSGFQLHTRFFELLKEIGYGGVDIFLFAAGIGSYYSFTKDELALPYLKRRLLRLAPVYIPFIIVWSVVQIIKGRMHPIFFLGNLLGVQNFSNAGISFNWYLCILILCYVLTPYLATFIKENDIKKCFVLIGVLLLATTAFWTDSKLIVSVTRLPIYAIGMVFAKYDSKEIKKVHICVGALLFVVGLAALMGCYKIFPEYLWIYGLNWYPFILITPFLCFIISYIVSSTEQNRIVSFVWNKCIGKIGIYSFECFLIHIFIFENAADWWDKWEMGYPMNNWIWLLFTLMIIPGVCILHAVSKQVRKVFRL